MARRATAPSSIARLFERQRAKAVAALRLAMPPPAAGEGGAERVPPATGDEAESRPARPPAKQQNMQRKPEAVDESSARGAKLVHLPADGDWPLPALRQGQCRFACTPHNAPSDAHRFCGRPTRISRSNLHGSWCDEHLPLVWGEGSIGERNADRLTRRVREA
ncbi:MULTISPECIES: hypothetical protein [Methylobacterium]|uniref:GcrA cell cycle regulator n=1 Tax=Methylobacterium jeotgali TaxID=381630 RepID=A0ABQ4T1H7_9HYPH|nr:MULTISPECIES: hypothetical protein [Methylobacterium]PIU06928.1 MAG: hypothetical protein COT56_07295 [Methylobacterium sp. CG09_land_8_20_14_0_10_71_15]PIU16140.1 MAG: hypothetical protein COT28_01615 [Methylobacterium sp. CG08_land_8_20_14_0_20_71_15]GBU18046.1 hypothetical protein AwMethylo_22610 [Methylobacterium sp.]GJE08650.1 hypothetical protein AOPFMNJM_3993 [Methylobacterium jeotgali]